LTESRIYQRKIRASQNHVMKANTFIYSYSLASVMFCTFFTGLHAQV